MKIVFATGNPGKLREASEILGEGFELVTPAEAGIPEDIPETGETLRANSLQKAQYIYEKTGLDCFADDTGLEVEILAGAPGVHTARYGGPQKNPADNIARLLREMACREREASVAREYGFNTPHATRRARFRTSVTLIIGGEKHFFDGIMEGQIARQSRPARAGSATTPSSSRTAMTSPPPRSPKKRKTPFPTAARPSGPWRTT